MGLEVLLVVIGLAVIVLFISKPKSKVQRKSKTFGDGLFQ